MIRLPLSRLHLHPCQQHSVFSRSPKVPLIRPTTFRTRASIRSSPSSTCITFMNEFPSFRGAGSLGDAITRSKSSSDVQTIVPELPEVPRIPSKKRTFHLNHEDLEALVQPLLSCHWHVGRVREGINGLDVFSLNKLFSFKNFTSAVEFFDLLAGIQNEENHHARVTVDYTNVYVSMHTHCAYHNAFNAGVDAKPVKTPGLTSRDIRFAVKVERVHDTFLRDGRAVTKVPVDSSSLQAWSMQQLQRRYPAHVA